MPLGPWRETLRRFNDGDVCGCAPQGPLRETLRRFNTLWRLSEALTLRRSAREIRRKFVAARGEDPAHVLTSKAMTRESLVLLHLLLQRIQAIESHVATNPFHKAYRDRLAVKVAIKIENIHFHTTVRFRVL